MVETTFKTMYLVSKSDLDNLENNNFKLSLQNKNICDGGMNVSVKPIKTRAQNKPPTKKTRETIETSEPEKSVIQRFIETKGEINLKT